MGAVPARVGEKMLSAGEHIDDQRAELWFSEN